MQRGEICIGECGWVSGNGILIFLSIHAVVTSIPKKTFSAWKRESIFVIGSEAQGKNTYGFRAETTLETEGN